MEPQPSPFDPFRFRPYLELSHYETKEFSPTTSDGCADALAWLEEPHEGQRVAMLRSSSGEQSCVMMPVPLYEHLDDLANKESYLAHWELDGILPEDLPTIHDALAAANDDLLFECIKEVLDNALYPSERPDLPGAYGYVCRMTDVVRDFEYDPCDSIIMLPRCRYRVEGQKIEREMQTVSLSFQDARIGNIRDKNDYRIRWWSPTLGLKAWFGGVSIRDEYRALAWLLCVMHADGLIDYGVWMGGRPARDYDHPSVRELNEWADDDLRRRAKNAMQRLGNPQDMTTLSFNCERETYDLLTKACAQHGLSIQNGIHILLRRLITYFGDSVKTSAQLSDKSHA